MDYLEITILCKVMTMGEEIQEKYSEGLKKILKKCT